MVISIITLCIYFLLHFIPKENRPKTSLYSDVCLWCFLILSEVNKTNQEFGSWPNSIFRLYAI